MAVALSLLDVDPGNTLNWIRVSLVFSGNYSTGGDTLDFTTIQGAVGFFGQALSSDQIPQQVFIASQSGNLANSYVFVKGTSLSNSKVKISNAAGTEIAAGAYPGGVTGDTVELQAAVRKLL